jgi:hypothetical protein
LLLSCWQQFFSFLQVQYEKFASDCLQAVTLPEKRTVEAMEASAMYFLFSGATVAW